MDPLHLFLIAGATTGFCALLLGVSRSRNRGIDPLGCWAIATALGACGLLARAAPIMGSALPRGAGDEISITFLLLAAGTSWMAARVFSGLSMVPIIGVVGALLWLPVGFLFGFEDSGPGPAAVLRAVVSWGGIAVYAFATAEALWSKRGERLSSRSAIVTLLIVHGLANLLRVALSIFTLDSATRAAISTSLLIESQLYFIGLAFLALAMTKERAEHTIGRSRDDAHKAGEARRRFLAQMSHEVRTPLNGVLGLAQVLHSDPRLLPDQRQQVQTLEAAGRHLLAIVNDALDLAKIDAGRLDYLIRPFNPAEAIEGCVALVRSAAVDKRINLKLELVGELPKLIAGDTTRLQQILLNLLWNALKFTPSGGKVSLRVGAGADWLRCDVIDNGPGIPPEKQSLLFHDFSRLDPAGSDGTGLGLVISARLAERMGGRLTYHPGPGGIGSLFQLDLPWAATAAPPPVEAPAPAPPPLPGGLRLLIVDDVRANRSLLSALLSADGHVVTETDNGLDAVRLVGQRDFDAVLMDIRMPGIDGIETTRRIHDLPGDAGATPVIAVSGDVMRETVQECLAAGMCALVPKPIERETLIGTLRRLDLQRYRQAEPAPSNGP